VIRNRTTFEGARNIETIVFNKTGTLTRGSSELPIYIGGSYSTEDDLSYAASVEALSQHPLAEGIFAKIKKVGITLKKVDDFESMTGKGLRGVVES